MVVRKSVEDLHHLLKMWRRKGEAIAGGLLQSWDEAGGLDLEERRENEDCLPLP